MAEIYNLLGSELFVSFIGILGTALISLLTWVTKNVNDYIKEEIDNKILKKVLTEANEVVFDSVKASMQEEVDQIKSKRGEEGLSEEEAERIKSRVVTRIMSKMNSKTLSKIDERFGDVQAFIEDKVEATVKDIKQSN